MALKIRLRQQGKKNRYVYRLVLTDSRSPRDGKYIEFLGWYNPFEEEADKHLSVDADRVQHWLDQGAVVTERAKTLINKSAPHVIEAYRKKILDHKVKECKKRRLSKKKKETALR